MSSLSPERGEWYSQRFEEALKHVESTFSADVVEEDIPQPAFMFREMQHTKTVDSVPPPRVHGLKSLQSLILKDRLEKEDWHVDPLGRILLGQEHYYRGGCNRILKSKPFHKALSNELLSAVRFNPSHSAASRQDMGRYYATQAQNPSVINSRGEAEKNAPSAISNESACAEVRQFEDKM